MSEKRAREPSNDNADASGAKAARTVSTSRPRAAPPAATYCPPTTKWLAAHVDVLPCITHRMALAVCSGCTPFAREHPYVETLRRLLEYREECGFVNMLYSYIPYPDNCVSYVSVVARRKEWLFGFAAHGKLTIPESWTLPKGIVLPFDPVRADEGDEMSMVELLYPFEYCVILGDRCLDAESVVSTWINASQRRLEKYARFSALVSDKTLPEDARAVYVKLFGTKDDENSDKEESGDEDE